MSTLLVQELVNHLSKNILDASENTKSPRSQASPVTVRSVIVAQQPSNKSDESLEPLYIITPTYRRPEQLPELTRMSHTLMLVKNVHWLVIEDATVATEQVTRLLDRTGLKFEHLTGSVIPVYFSLFYRLISTTVL